MKLVFLPLLTIFLLSGCVTRTPAMSDENRELQGIHKRLLLKNQDRNPASLKELTGS